MIKAIVFDLDNTLVKIKGSAKYIGTLECLKFLKDKYKLAVLTDAPKHMAVKRLKEAKIYHYFDFVVTYDDTGFKKPHHKPFFLMLDKLKLYPHEVLMVGDNLQKDILGAKQVLMKTCHVNRKGIVPDYTIKELTQLKGILK